MFEVGERGRGRVWWCEGEKQEKGEGCAGVSECGGTGSASTVILPYYLIVYYLFFGLL